MTPYPARTRLIQRVAVCEREAWTQCPRTQELPLSGAMDQKRGMCRKASHGAMKVRWHAGGGVCAVGSNGSRPHYDVVDTAGKSGAEGWSVPH
jgi:hypothetical protein